MKLMIGPVRVDVQRVGEPAPLEHRGHDAERGRRPRAGSRAAALIGTAIERNTIVSSTSERPTTKTPNGSRAAPSWSEMSIATAVKPVTLTSMPYSSSSRSCCARSLARRASAVAGSSGAGRGSTCTMPVSAVSFGRGEGTSSTPGRRSTSSARSSIRPSGSVEVDDRAGEDERAVEAGAELLGDEVVALARPARPRAASPAFGQGEARGSRRDRQRRRGPRTTATIGRGIGIAS